MSRIRIAIALAATTLVEVHATNGAGDANLPNPNGPGFGTLAMILLGLMLAFAIAVAAVRTWYLAVSDSGRRKEDMPSAQERELVSLLQVAKLASEQGIQLEQERAARRNTESELSKSRSLLERTLGERLRLGRVLHDDTCQVLYGVTLHLDALRSLLATRAPDLEPGVAKSLEQLRTLNRRVRSYVDQLETQPLPVSSWRSLTSAATAPFSGLPGLSFEFHLAARIADAPLEPEFAEDVTHILREAVSNAIRHGKASKIRIHVSMTDDGTVLSIEDDGTGFDPSLAHVGHGLANMRERATRTGATFAMTSPPTRISITWPPKTPVS
jgi:signal transduction histidine kinase